MEKIMPANVANRTGVGGQSGAPAHQGNAERDSIRQIEAVTRFLATRISLNAGGDVK